MTSLSKKVLSLKLHDEVNLNGLSMEKELSSEHINLPQIFAHTSASVSPPPGETAINADVTTYVGHWRNLKSINALLVDSNNNDTPFRRRHRSMGNVKLNFSGQKGPEINVKNERQQKLTAAPPLPSPLKTAKSSSDFSARHPSIILGGDQTFTGILQGNSFKTQDSFLQGQQRRKSGLVLPLEARVKAKSLNNLLTAIKSGEESDELPKSASSTTKLICLKSAKSSSKSNLTGSKTTLSSSNLSSSSSRLGEDAKVWRPVGAGMSEARRETFLQNKERGFQIAKLARLELEKKQKADDGDSVDDYVDDNSDALKEKTRRERENSLRPRVEKPKITKSLVLTTLQSLVEKKDAYANCPSSPILSNQPTVCNSSSKESSDFLKDFMRLDHQSVSKHQNESFDMFRNVNLIALPQGDILLEELVEIIWRAFLYFRSMKTPLINGNLAEQLTLIIEQDAPHNLKASRIKNAVNRLQRDVFLSLKVSILHLSRICTHLLEFDVLGNLSSVFGSVLMELPIYSISPASKVVGFALRQQLPSPSSNHLSFNENGRELLINGDEEEEEGNEEADDQKKIPGYQDDFLFLTTVHSRKASKAEVDNHPLNLEPYFFPRPIFVNDAKDLTKEQLLIQLFDAILVGDRQSSVLSLLIQNYNYCFLAE